MRARIIAIVMGVVMLLIGLVLADIVTGTAAKQGASDLVSCTTEAGASKAATDAEITADACADTHPNEIYPVVTSFAGAKSLNDLVPLVYYTIIVMISVSLIGIGTVGFTGRGPLAQG